MKIIIFVLSILFLSTNLICAQSIKVVTEDYPPYNYLNDDVLTGVAYQIVKAVIEETGFDASFGVYPWARAYKMALEMENVLIFSIYRSEEREGLFKWVGVIADQRTYFYSLKSRADLIIKELDDAISYRIGVVRNDNTFQYLKSKGFEDLEEVKSKEQSLLMLRNNRIDLADFIDVTFTYYTQKLGFDPDIFEKEYYFDQITDGLNMAFSNTTSDEVVKQFQDALERIKNNGTYDEIYKNWLLDS